MLTCGVTAGFFAGIFAALLHFALLQPLILAAERYESGEIVHFSGTDVAPAEHSGGAAATAGMQLPDAPSALQRNGLTGLFTALVYAGYGLILVAGFTVAGATGRGILPRQGLMWGLAGFAAFQLAPAMGLPPELPGAAAPDLAARQIWWWATVVATASGLALMTTRRTLPILALAAAVIAAPHVIGAPQAQGFAGSAPPELASVFTARVLGTGMLAWSALGVLAALLWSRQE